MSQDLPRWRSLLFVPAHIERFVLRAHERGSDAIILDLEDAVPKPEKAAARHMLPGAIDTVRRCGAAVLVRVNSELRELAKDLDAAIRPSVAALVLPKTEDAGWVRAIAAAVLELEMERGLEPGGIRLVLQIESPACLAILPALASSHERVMALALGTEDYSAAIGSEPDAETLLHPSLALLHAARAAGRQALGFVDSIGAFSDLDQFRQTIKRARKFGFRGAMAVHPSQVAILNEGFAPDAKEIDWARRVIEADRAAREAGRGAFQLDGRMVDAPVVRRAEEILRMQAVAAPAP